MVAIASFRCIVIALVAGLTGAGVAHADDNVADVTQVTQVGPVDTPNVTPRSLPGYRSDLTELSISRWASSGRVDVGVGVGSVMLVDRPTGLLAGRLKVRRS